MRTLQAKWECPVPPPMGGMGPGQPCPSATLLPPLEVPSVALVQPEPRRVSENRVPLSQEPEGDSKVPEVTRPSPLRAVGTPAVQPRGCLGAPAPHRTAGGTGVRPGRRAVLRVTCLALVSSSGPGAWHPCRPRLREGPERLPLALPVLKSFCFPCWDKSPREVCPGGWLPTVPGRAINTLAAAVLPGLFGAPHASALAGPPPTPAPWPLLPPLPVPGALDSRTAAWDMMDKGASVWPPPLSHRKGHLS